MLDVMALITLVCQKHKILILEEDVEAAVNKKMMMFQRAKKIGTITDVDN